MSDGGTLLSDIPTTTLTRAQRRWRKAYLTIYSTRMMLSLISKSRQESEKSPPRYPVLEIQPTVSQNQVVLNSFDPFVYKTTLRMLENKDLKHLHVLGGVEGVATALGVSSDNGIGGSKDDITRRSQIFGTNSYHKPPPKGFRYFLIGAFKNTAIFILLVWAALALAFGIKQHGVEEGWYEGVSIIVAVLLMVALSAVSNLIEETQSNERKELSINIKVEVVRDARHQQVSLFDLVVGDVVLLRTGDQIPADGLFLKGYRLEVDESSMTGENDFVEVNSNHNPFLLSGTKVVDGYGQMLVVSVGMNTTWGRMMSSIADDQSNEKTQLQARLDKLICSIEKLGFSLAFLVLAYLLFNYFTGKTKDKNGNKEYNGSKTDLDAIFKSVAHILTATVATLVAAILSGLPVAVTLTLAYSMKRMMADQAMVKKLSGYEKMSSATVVCTEKTGILTLKQMKVTEFWLGQESIKKDSRDMVASNVRELFYQAVGLNTTGGVYKPVSGSVPEFSGSPTEKAILSWATQELGMNMEKVKQKYTILQVETFNSDKKRSGVSIRKTDDNTIHVHWKGAAEMILAMCSQYYENNGVTKTIDEDERQKTENMIDSMAAKGLRCIAFAHKKIFKEEMQYNEDGNTHQTLREDDLTLLGIVTLKDPCRPGEKTDVEICKSAGLGIKMITGDNVFTAKAIARECGILQYKAQAKNDEEVVEGKQFRNYTPEDRMEKVDKIRVMARSSPFDKLLMVKCLKEKGHVVVVTGEDNNDAPALKKADIGLWMGIQGCEIAKESSDIVILDDKFTTVATTLKWGRCFNNNIKTFIQFQLTFNIAALVINVVAGFVPGNKIPLTAVQLVWVNIILDTLVALALATERPTDELMKNPPQGHTEPIITNIMWRNLLYQALYQIAVLLILQFVGESIFKVSPEVNGTMVFNTFFLCQVFSFFNARKLEKTNVFRGIHKNKLYLGLMGVAILVQFLKVEILNKFASKERLNWRQWLTCNALGAFTLPIGFIVKFIHVPEKPVLLINSDESVSSTAKRAEEFLTLINENKINLEAPFHIKDYFNALNLRCVERLYGDHGLDMMGILRKNPALALPKFNSSEAVAR
ncbi:calcium-transporting ATPase 12, plasma membrane-type-like [Pistacia vera]|uniref:calcium-transporting ATPase 12, plasma membrane-type-like n=1 Tax=Pistacia vera TaxID=55513 RepID=UPI001262C16F|nr:calcium-transporting ATPase 12, plasma membrane-type-like [Pistacia vera]